MIQQLQSQNTADTAAAISLQFTPTPLLGYRASICTAHLSGQSNIRVYNKRLVWFIIFNNVKCVFIRHQFSTLYEILVRIGSVSPEFKTLEVIRPASKILPHLVQIKRSGARLLGTDVISKEVFFISIHYGAILRRRAGYTLGFATHFYFVLIRCFTFWYTLSYVLYTVSNLLTFRLWFLHARVHCTSVANTSYRLEVRDHD